MLFEIINLRVSYKGAQVVQGISLYVEKGEIVTLIGSNGAGKSTTLRTVSGLKSPLSGEIWFNGERVDHASPDKIVKSGISHIPQGRWVFPSMSVQENLKLGAYRRRDKAQVKADFEAILEEFPILRTRKGQRARTLSGGEQQMLVIGRALMSRPELLLMDEPSLGLAPIMVRKIGDIIMDINTRRNMSILLVEQNAQLALSVAVRGYVLEMGKIPLSGKCNDLLNSEQVKKAYVS